MAKVRSEIPGYTVTACFSYGQYNLGSVHAESGASALSVNGGTYEGGKRNLQGCLQSNEHALS